MTEKSPKMVCPDCGAELNHHAEKLAEPTSAEEALRMDPELGGILEEIHCCPGCGKNESRRMG